MLILVMLQELMKFAGENVNNADTLKVIFSSLVSIGKLFYALNSQVRTSTSHSF